jgi:ATP-dependent DNA helicase RecG
MVKSSDARAEAIEVLFDGVLAGNNVDQHEGMLVDCKEDPSRRGAQGALIPGTPQSDQLAKTVADAAACFANASGGAVIVGVNDKATGSTAFLGTPADTAWLQNRVRQLLAVEVQVAERIVNGNRIVVVTVEPSYIPVQDTSRRYRRRQGRDCNDMSGAELGQFSVNRSSADWSASSTASTSNDADPAALRQLRKWLRDSAESTRLDIANSDDQTLLRQLRLVDEGGRFNRAGELFCVRLPGRGPLLDFIYKEAPGADTEKRLDDSEQPLATALAEAEEAIALRNPQYQMTEGLVVGQVRAIPEFALREAIVNAVAHRDWSAAGPIRIQLEGTQLTVTNPGGFLPGVTSETVITAPPHSRNPLLARVLRGLRLAEAEGSGVDRMFREVVRNGLPVPNISELPDGTGVRCVLTGGRPDAGVTAVVAGLTPPANQDIDVLLILHFLEDHPTVNAITLAPVIQKSRQEAASALQRAFEAELIVPSSREAHFRLADVPRERLKNRLSYLRRTESDYAVVIEIFIANHGEVRARDLIDACGISSVTASRALAQATTSGLITKHGTKGAGVYYTTFTESR